MPIDELVADLSRAFRLPSLLADAAGVYRISFDDIALSIRQDAAVVQVQTSVGTAKAEDGELHESLLSANFFGDGPGGAALALTGDNDIILTRRLQLERLEFDNFTDALQVFVNYAEYWQQKLSGKAVTATFAPWQEANPGMFFIRG